MGDGEPSTHAQIAERKRNRPTGISERIRVNRKTLTNIIIVVVLVAVVWGVSALQRSARATGLTKDLQVQDDYQAYRAMRKMNGLGAAAQARAVPLLKAAEPYLRARAAILVGNTGNPRHAPAVLELLQDPDATVRAAAATALGRLGAGAAVQPLTALLQQATQPLEVRTAAARSLALLAAPEAAPVLIALLQAPSDPQEAALRQAATIALGTVKSKEAVEELTALLQPDREPDVVVRTLAAEALAHAAPAEERQGMQVGEALIGAMRDEASEVRIAAVHSLGMVALPAAMGERSRAALEEARNDDEYWVREAAEEALR